MRPIDRMVLVTMSAQDLEEAVRAYEKAKKDSGRVWAGYEVPMYHSKESIKRRIVQMRQDLLMLEKSL